MTTLLKVVHVVDLQAYEVRDVYTNETKAVFDTFEDAKAYRLQHSVL